LIIASRPKYNPIMKRTEKNKSLIITGTMAIYVPEMIKKKNEKIEMLRSKLKKIVEILANAG
jgi:hypothetical protein